MDLDNLAWVVPLVLIYGVVFILVASALIGEACGCQTRKPKLDQPWVPAATTRDACAMPFYPFFLLLPAIFWPLVAAYRFLSSIGACLRNSYSSATSICGIPLPRKKQTGGNSETTPDLELGIVAGGGGGLPEGGPGRAKAPWADSAESESSAGSENPPPYTSVASG